MSGMGKRHGKQWLFDLARIMPRPDPIPENIPEINPSSTTAPLGERPSGNHLSPLRALELLCAVLTVLGGLGMMFVNFWAGIIVLDVSAVILAIILIYERALLFRLFVIPWMLGIRWLNQSVLHPSPFTLMVQHQDDLSFLPANDHRDDVTYLHISLINDTDDDFSNIDLIVKPDVPIVSITMFPDVLTSCSLHGDSIKEMITIGTVRVEAPSLKRTNPDGSQTLIPLRQLSISQYRLVCSQIVRHSSVELVAAVATLKRRAPTSHDFITGGPVFAKNGEKLGEIFWGFLDIPESMFGYDKTPPRYVHLSGQYTAHFRPIKAGLDGAVAP